MRTITVTVQSFVRKNQIEELYAPAPDNLNSPTLPALPSSTLMSSSPALNSLTALDKYQKELIEKINLAPLSSSNRFISFSLDEIKFCVKNSQVCEFVSMQDVEYLKNLYILPQNHNYIVGLINYNSKILCVLDLRAYLGLDNNAPASLPPNFNPSTTYKNFDNEAGILIFQTGDIYFAITCPNLPKIEQLDLDNYEFLEPHDITQFSSFDKIMLSIANYEPNLAKKIKKITKSLIINKTFLSKFLSVVPFEPSNHILQPADFSSNDLLTAIELKPTQDLAIALDLMDKPN